MSHHSTLPPSSAPALMQCPCFRSDKRESAQKSSGTERHKAYGALLLGDASLVDKLPADERDGVIWAADYTRLHCDSEYPMAIEEKLSLIDEDFNEITFGTPDVVTGPAFFDLKWMQDDYREQMLLYALMIMQRYNLPTATCHVLFAESTYAKVYEFNFESASIEFAAFLVRFNDPNKQPKACDFCGWCANALDCPALTASAGAVASGREDWGLEQYHVSKITDPTEMAKAYTLAKHLEDWVEAVKFHTKTMMASGTELPGYELKTQQGDRFITDTAKAFESVDLPREKFLPLVSIALGKLTKAYAEHHGMTVKKADKAIEEKLSAVIAREKPKQLIKKK